MAKKSIAQIKNKGGRPISFKEEYVEQVYKLCLLGATDEDIARFFNKSVSTINEWKLKYPKFSESLKAGKEIADAEVADKLLQRAKGYSHPEDKIFNNDGVPLIVPTVKHYPPDTTAAIFWLKNRQPAKWRDKQDHVVGGDKDNPIKQDLAIKIIKSDTPFNEHEEDIE